LGRLEGAGYALDVTPVYGLVSETVRTIQETNPQMVVLGSLHDGRRTRHLVKRLRSACGDIPMLVGCWGPWSSSEFRRELSRTGADEVVTTLAQARSALRRIAESRSSLDRAGTLPVETIESAEATR